MSGYICPICEKTTKLPAFCCRESMVQRGMYYCNNCKSQAYTASNCCGSPMRQL